MCGVMMTRSPNERNGLSAGSGSVSNTSSAAPAMRSVWSASISAGSSIAGPREVLMRMAVGFISRKPAASIICRVSLVRTTCSVTTSDSRSSVSSGTRSTPRLAKCSSETYGSWPTMRTFHGVRKRDRREPMRPRPMMPMVSPS